MPIRFVDWSETDFLLAEGDPRLSGERGWCSLIPALHRHLGDPGATIDFPAFRFDQEHTEAANYWETAVHLLYLLLGWADPGKGLQAWYRAGKPATDTRLRFLRDVYDPQGQLGMLARHLWERGSPQHEQMLSECSQREWLATSRRPEEFLGSEWLRELETTFPVGRLRRDPYHGGANPLHLWHSVDPHDGLARPESAMHVMPSDRRAVLTLDRATGWYRALCERGADLPFLGDRSWHVEVVVKPLGWMGTFRQSRTTRLWFQGRHMVHMMGN